MSPAHPAKLFWLGVIAVFWTLYGLAGRDAWQAEEAHALASVLDWLEGATSIWAVPAPLFTLVAGLFSHLTPFGLDIQESARLASGLFILTALLATGLAGRTLLGSGFGPAASLALMGGFGLMLRAHALLPETALLATWSLLLLGMGWSRTNPGAGGLLLGLCLAALTLGLRGLPDMVAALGVMLAPLAFPAWRERGYRQALVLGLGLGGSLILLGVALMAGAGQFEAWLQWHGPQRFLPGLGPAKLFSELAWFAWPLWPLALAAVWHDHRRLGRSHVLHLPLLALALLLLAAIAPAWSRLGGLLPVLLPLALLSAQSLAHLRRGAAQAFYWFGVLCLLFFSFAFWVYFSAIEWGFPAKLAAHVARLTPAYVPGSVESGAIWLAAGTTLLWLLAIPLFPRAQIRPVLVWATGMILVWTLLAALYRPWAEAGWGYRPLVTQLEQRLPDGACLDARVDAAMATMLRYHLGTGFQPVADCPWRLSLISRDEGRAPAAEGHDLVWQGHRARYKNQVYRLEQRREE